MPPMTPQPAGTTSSASSLGSPASAPASARGSASPGLALGGASSPVPGLAFPTSPAALASPPPEALASAPPTDAQVAARAALCAFLPPLALEDPVSALDALPAERREEACSLVLDLAEALLPALPPTPRPGAAPNAYARAYLPHKGKGPKDAALLAGFALRLRPESERAQLLAGVTAFDSGRLIFGMQRLQCLAAAAKAAGEARGELASAVASALGSAEDSRSRAAIFEQACQSAQSVFKRAPDGAIVPKRKGASAHNRSAFAEYETNPCEHSDGSGNLKTPSLLSALHLRSHAEFARIGSWNLLAKGRGCWRAISGLSLRSGTVASDGPSQTTPTSSRRFSGTSTTSPGATARSGGTR